MDSPSAEGNSPPPQESESGYESGPQPGEESRMMMQPNGNAANLGPSNTLWRPSALQPPQPQACWPVQPTFIPSGGLPFNPLYNLTGVGMYPSAYQFPSIGGYGGIPYLYQPTQQHHLAYLAAAAAAAASNWGASSSASTPVQGMGMGMMGTGAGIGNGSGVGTGTGTGAGMSQYSMQQQQDDFQQLENWAQNGLEITPSDWAMANPLHRQTWAMFQNSRQAMPWSGGDESGRNFSQQTLMNAQQPSQQPQQPNNGAAGVQWSMHFPPPTTPTARGGPPNSNPTPRSDGPTPNRAPLFDRPPPFPSSWFVPMTPPAPPTAAEWARMNHQGQAYDGFETDLNNSMTNRMMEYGGFYDSADVERMNAASPTPRV